MQVAFLSKSKNNVFNTPTILFVLGCISFIIYSSIYGNEQITSYKFALGMLITMTCFYVEFVISVISQMRSVLKIHLFDLNYARIQSWSCLSLNYFQSCSVTIN
jgi:hypothetical protein